MREIKLLFTSEKDKEDYRKLFIDSRIEFVYCFNSNLRQEKDNQHYLKIGFIWESDKEKALQLYASYK